MICAASSVGGQLSPPGNSQGRFPTASTITATTAAATATSATRRRRACSEMLPHPSLAVRLTEARIGPGAGRRTRGLYRASAPLFGHEVDHQRHALEPVVPTQAVLEVVGPVAGDQAAVVDLDRDSRWRGAHLGRVVQPQSLAAPGGRW